MKFSFKFSNLLSTVYKKGNLIFTPDGNCLISPVGNRITIFDLRNNKSRTLPVESRFNYTSIALSPNGCTLIAVNEEGEAHLISLISQTIVHRYRFKGRVRAVSFSPDSKHFAACKENNVFVFKAPGPFTGEFNSFVMERVFHQSLGETTCLDWSFDSKILAVGSKDMTIKLYTLDKYSNFHTYSLGSHKDSIVGCFFEENSYDITTISKNGQANIWECSIDPESLVPQEGPVIKRQRADSDSDLEDDIDATKGEKSAQELSSALNEVSIKDEQVLGDNEKKNKMYYKRISRHYLADKVKKSDLDALLTAAVYHKKSKILVVGFSTGAFFIYELPDMNLIHSLSISEQKITAVSLNAPGDWIAFGCSDLGQLLVWEWQSETYVLKQQGHTNNMSCISYSADGQYMATGGEDGKVKLWNVHSGFCFVTFSEHAGAVSDVAFSFNKKFVVSSSLDGTVRAYDITRYRNFRTLTAPRPVQFSCVSIDGSGEFIAAGGQDVFEIFLWSVKIGKLLMLLPGHEGPVCSLSFSPSIVSSALASISWDKTLKLWNAVEHESQHETVELLSDGLCVSYSPNGEDVAVATLNGDITIYNVKTAAQIKLIEGRFDLGTGRSESDVITAKQTQKARAFTSLCYSASGEYILAGGQSKYVCIYNVEEALLVKKFEITQNRSLDAVDDFINRRKMTEFGNIALVEEREELEGGKVAVKLPGTKHGDAAARTSKPEVRVFSIRFSPTGDAWAAATTEGLLVYSLNNDSLFDPWGLQLSVTPDSVRKMAARKEHAQALMMALRLNEAKLIQEIIEGIPSQDIELTVSSLPEEYAIRTLRAIVVSLESSRHLEFYLNWTLALLGKHHSAKIPHPMIVALHRALQQKYDQLSKICDFNKYTLRYISQMSEHERKLKRIKNEESGSESSSSDEEMLLET